jgi:FG-GAP-like repeat/ASPIC and UnbV
MSTTRSHWVSAVLAVVALAAAIAIACQRSESPAPASAAPKIQPPGHMRMLEVLKAIAAETNTRNVFMGGVLTAPAGAELAGLSPAQTEFARLTRLAMDNQGLGHELEAIDYFQQAFDLAARSHRAIPVLVEFELVFRMAVAYMRLAETQNCVQHQGADSCILPIRGDGIHGQQEGSRKAIQMLTVVLNAAREGTPRYLEARWLLNLAYMTIGEYPDQVPLKWVIPPQAFESEEGFPHFTNIASKAGLEFFGLAGGVIIDDFDNDGYLDVVVSTWDPKGQLRLFRNNRDGTFSDRTEAAGLSGLFGGINVIQADYNNDGFTDILVMRGGWLQRDGRHPSSLLRNNGDGTFTDVTFEAGLGNVFLPTHSAAWADYDNDGYLDLYVGHESSAAHPPESKGTPQGWAGRGHEVEAPSQLFHNNRDGTFTEVAAKAGVQNFRYAKGVVWGDYDGDRRPDLYVSNFGEANRLYHNNGDGTFTDVAERLGVTGPTMSFPAWFWDFDNDGVLDLFVAAFDATIADVASHALGQRSGAELPALYRGTGDGHFENVARQYNLVRPAAVMGANFGDLDNDGYLDFYLGTGRPGYEQLMPKLMYHSQQGKRFADVTTAGGFGHIQKGHGVAFGDLDNDGDEDVFEEMGGAQPGDGYRSVLYENQGFGNHWIAIKAVGVKSNRSAIGARIRAEVIEDGKPRSIYRYVNSGGSFGANPLRQTLGVGKATRIEVLDVFWPTTGLTQTFRNVPADEFIEVVEGSSSFKKMSLKRLVLGGSQ